MSRPVSAPAVVVALVAGGLRGLRPNLSVLLFRGYDLDAAATGTVLTATTLLVLLASPLATFVVGYRWGRTTEVATDYGGFGFRLFVAALLAFVVAYVASLLPLLPTVGPGLLSNLAAVAVSAIDLVHLPLAAIAGAFIADVGR